MGSSGKNNIVFLIFILAIAGLGAGWYFYYSSPEDQALVVTEGGIAENPNAANVRMSVLGNIQAIESIRLDTTILNDPDFLRLQKVPRPFFPSPEVGRDNPFLPYKAAISPKK